MSGNRKEVNMVKNQLYNVNDENIYANKDVDDFRNQENVYSNYEVDTHESKKASNFSRKGNKAINYKDVGSQLRFGGGSKRRGAKKTKRKPITKGRRSRRRRTTTKRR